MVMMVVVGSSTVRDWIGVSSRLTNRSRTTGV